MENVSRINKYVCVHSKEHLKISDNPSHRNKVYPKNVFALIWSAISMQKI